MRNRRYDYQKLHGLIVQKYGNYTGLSIDLGISRQTLSNKINGLCSFSNYQIERICDLLDIPKSEIGDYFFTRKES